MLLIELLGYEKEDIETVLDYLRDSSWYNSYLRGGREGIQIQRDKVMMLDSIIETIKPITSPMTLYRAVPNHVFEDKKKGDTYIDKGYVSTSSNKASVNHPGYVHRDDRMVLTIKVPSGIKVVNMSELVQTSIHAPDKAKQLAAWEDEFLLPRGLTFKILSLTKKTGIVEVLG
jgi:hypothetical protein